MESSDLVTLLTQSWTGLYPYFQSWLTNANVPVSNGQASFSPGTSSAYYINDISVGGHVDYYMTFVATVVNHMITSATGTVNGLSSYIAYNDDGVSSSISGFKAIQDPTVNFSVPVTPVPGPEAGTDLAAMAMAGVGVLVYRRKQKMAA